MDCNGKIHSSLVMIGCGFVTINAYVDCCCNYTVSVYVNGELSQTFLAPGSASQYLVDCDVLSFLITCGGANSKAIEHACCANAHTTINCQKNAFSLVQNQDNTLRVVRNRLPAKFKRKSVRSQ